MLGLTTKLTTKPTENRGMWRSIWHELRRPRFVDAPRRDGGNRGAVGRVHACRRDGHPETTEPAADRLLARGHAGSRPRLCGRPGPEPRDEIPDGLKSDLLIDPALAFRHPEARSPKMPGVRVVYGWVHQNFVFSLGRAN